MSGTEMTASAYAVEPESGSAPAKPVEETPAEHQAALEKTGHKEWGKLKMAVKVEKRFHEKHKHKIICGTCALITTIIIIILVVALAVAAAVYFTRQPSSSEMALQAKSQNAIVNIGTQSVVPPKDNSKTKKRRLMKEYEQASMFEKLFKDLAADTKKSYHGLRNLASHEATAAIDTTTFAETSDYNVVHTGRSVEDGLSSSLKTANMILCMLSQTSAGGFFNKGSYIANVDEVKCEPAAGGGGGGGGGGQAAAPKRKITPWTVIATGPNATTPEGLFEISAWLEIGDGGPNGKINLEFKMEVEKSLIFEDEDGTMYPSEFSIQFDEPKDSSIKGLIKTSTSSSGDREFIYVMEQNMEGMVMEQTVLASINNVTEDGYAIVTNKMEGEYMGQSLLQESINNVAWSATHFKKTDTVCLDRENNVEVGQEYHLFDSDGKAVKVEAYIRIQTTTTIVGTLASGTVVPVGTVFAASLWEGGMWFENDWDEETYEPRWNWDDEASILSTYFQDGASVKESVWGDDGPEAGAEFILSKIPAKMSITSKKEQPMSKYAGQEFEIWHDGKCPLTWTFTINSAKITATKDALVTQGTSTGKILTALDGTDTTTIVIVAAAAQKLDSSSDTDISYVATANLKIGVGANQVTISASDITDVSSNAQQLKNGMMGDTYWGQVKVTYDAGKWYDVKESAEDDHCYPKSSNGRRRRQRQRRLTACDASDDCAGCVKDGNGDDVQGATDCTFDVGQNECTRTDGATLLDSPSTVAHCDPNEPNDQNNNENNDPNNGCDPMQDPDCDQNNNENNDPNNGPGDMDNMDMDNMDMENMDDMGYDPMEEWKPPVFKVLTPRREHVFSEWDWGIDLYSEIDGSHGFVDKEHLDKVEWYNYRQASPKKVGTIINLYCVNNCIDPTKLDKSSTCTTDAQFTENECSKKAVCGIYNYETGAESYDTSISCEQYDDAYNYKECDTAVQDACDAKGGWMTTGWMETQSYYPNANANKQTEYGYACEDGSKPTCSTDEECMNTDTGEYNYPECGGGCTDPKCSTGGVKEACMGWGDCTDPCVDAGATYTQATDWRGDWSCEAMWVQLPGPPITIADARLYKFDTAKALLYADGSTTPLIAQPTDDGMNQVMMSLVEDTPKTWEKLSSCVDPGSWDCLDILPSYYEWSTGSSWEQITYLTAVSDGAVRMPVGSKRLSIKFPDENLDSLSGKDYSNMELDFTYEDGWISGLPEVCLNQDTFEIFEGKISVHEGTMNLDCWRGNSESNVWQTADVLLPLGTTVTEEDPETGDLTLYVLKATSITQMLVGVSKDLCASVPELPTTAISPTITSNWDDTMILADKPMVAPAVLVEAGEVLIPEDENDPSNDPSSLGMASTTPSAV